MGPLRSIFGSVLLATSAQAAIVNYIQTSVNDADASTIGAVSSSQYLETAVTYPTVTASSTFSSYRFTHWTNSSYPDTSYRDAWGRSLNPISFVLLKATTATAHYLPATRDIDADGVPDWYEVEYFGDLARAAGYDGDGDGIALLAEYTGGTHPLHGNSQQEGGVAWADSEMVTVNLAGYASYTLRSVPAGTVSQTTTVAPPGTVVTTPDLAANASFGYWTLDGVRQQDAWGVALAQISFTMASVNREAVAYLFAGDGDGDGVPDAWEQYHFGTLANGAGFDSDGDGMGLLAEYTGGTNPLHGNGSQEGGVAWADSAMVTVNLANYARYTLSSVPAGTVNASAIVPDGTVITTPDMTQSTFGYWTLDGVRQQDAWGVALRQVSFTVNGADRTGVAHLFASDSDGDGINDGFEQYHFGTLAKGAGFDSDGDGIGLLAEFTGGTSPLHGNSHQEGGVAWADSGMVAVNYYAYNEAPLFTMGTAHPALEDSGANVVPGWATAIAPGPSGEFDQTLAFELTATNQGLFSVQPAMTPQGTLTFTPAPNAVGTSEVTVVLKDDGGVEAGGIDRSAPKTFTITVRPVNDAPLFTMGTARTTLEDSVPNVVPCWATAIAPGPSNESGQAVAFELTATNQGLFSVQPAMTPQGTLTFTPAPNAVGTSEVTVVLKDDGGIETGGIDRSAPRRFTVTIRPVNDPPSFVKGSNVAVREDAGAQTVAGWATAILSGPADESAQTMSFLLTNDNPTLFRKAPAVAKNGTLTFTPAANAFGTASLSVVLRDTGGTTNGGVNVSAPQTFTITVTRVNDAPSFVKGANQAVVADGGPKAVTGWATRIAAGPANESGQALSFEVTANSNAALFAAGPSVDAAGTLRYESAAGMFGTAAVSLRLRDSGGTEDGGVEVSAVQSFVITVGRANAIDNMVGIGEEAAGVTGARLLRVNPLASINAGGLLAYSGVMVTGPGGVTARNAQGMWAEASEGVPMLVGRTGQPAPDAHGNPSSLVFGAIPEIPSLNADGTLAFLNRVMPLGSIAGSGTHSLFAGRPGPGNLRRLAQAGESLGTTGLAFLGFTGQPILSETGDVVIRTSLAEGGTAGVTAADNSALVLFRPDGTPEVLVREGSAAPGSVQQFEDFAGTLAAGTSVFRNRTGATIFNQRLRGIARDGIWKHDGASLQAIMVQGYPAPEAGAALFGQPGFPSLTETGGNQSDDRGLVVFQTLLTGTGVTAANSQAIYFLFTQGTTPRLFVRSGVFQSAGTHGPVGVDGTDRFSKLGTPITAADGNFGFIGTLAANGSLVTASSDTGIWGTLGANGPEEFRLIAREGSEAPDLKGNPRSGVRFTAFGTPVFGDHGRAAFTATLSNGKTGLYIAASNGQLREALTTEAAITVSDIDRGTRAVTPFAILLAPSPAPLQQRAFGGGILVATVKFSDGSGAAVTFLVP